MSEPLDEAAAPPTPPQTTPALPIPAPLDDPLPADPTPDTTPAAAAPVVMERPHPASPLVKGWIALVAITLSVGRDTVDDLFKPHHPDSNPMALWFVLGGLGVFVLVTAVFGYFSWRFTKFVVDDHQLRIDHDFIWHNSEKVPLTKIQSVDVVQPLAARLIGLAALRVDVGGGKPVKIEYLGRERSYRMRDYLVARAHGQQVTLDEMASRPVASVLTDQAEHETVLLRVPGARLVLGAVLSTEFLVALVSAVAVVGTSVLFDGEAALGVMVPLVMTMVGVIGQQVVQQWNYRLLRSGQALKVSRGMTALVSQSLPTRRVQGLAVTQHLAWRPFGLYRVRMDVLGYSGGEDAKDQPSDILLPVGTWAEVTTAVQAVWPDFSFDAVELHRPPSRARWLHPFAFGWMAWGSTDEVMMSRTGALVRRIALVHHARVQSAELEQGPLQRRMGLATASLHTSVGPVELHVRSIDAALARSLVSDEMDVCRAARRLDAERQALDALPLPSPSLPPLPDQPLPDEPAHSDETAHPRLGLE